MGNRAAAGAPGRDRGHRLVTEARSSAMNVEERQRITVAPAVVKNSA